jgi:hypothetical protein
LYSVFISFDPMGEALKLRKLALVNLQEPDIQTLSLRLM